MARTTFAMTLHNAVLSVLATSTLAGLGLGQEIFDAPSVVLNEVQPPFRRMIDLGSDGVPDFVGAWTNHNNAQFRVALYGNDGRGNITQQWLDNAVLPGSQAAGKSTTLQIQVADLDGDGDEDFAAALGSDVFDFLIEGQTVTKVAVNTTLDGVFGMGLKDLDGDGAADHVLSHFDKIAIHLSQTGTNYSFAHDLYDFPLSLGPTAEVIVRFADGDGDGDMDVIALGNERYQWIYLAADGSLDSVGARQDLGFDHSMADMGDIDGDGDEDLVFFDMSGVYRILRQEPLGTYTLESAVVGGPAEFLRDVDGDGDLDGVCCGGGGGTQPFDDNLLESDFEIAINLGGGVFAPAVSRPGLGSPELADVVDVDGDGTLDIVAGRVIWHDAGASLASLSPSAGGGPSHLLADVDGDSDPDFGLTLDQVSINLGDGHSELRVPSISGTPAGVAYGGPGFSGDVDGDGDPDLLVEAYAGESLLGMHKLLNAGGGHLIDGGLASGRGVSFGLGDLEPANGLFADLDRDGDMDLVTRTPAGTESIAVWKQGPSGLFSLFQTIPGVRTNAIADFNQDGLQDLLVMEPMGAFALGRLQIMVGQRTGFQLDPTVLAGSGYLFQMDLESKVAVVDLQSNGYPDIALAASQLTLIRNRLPFDGVFTFTATTGYAEYIQTDGKVFAADVNADGFNDLVFGPLDKSPRSMGVQISHGTGTWGEGYDHYEYVAEGTQPMDLDGDGDLDLGGSPMTRGMTVANHTNGERAQYGAALPGFGGASPTLGAKGPFTPGASSDLRVTGAPGGAMTVIAISAGEASLPGFPVAGVTAYVDPFLPGGVLISLVANATPGAAGAGELTLPYIVPQSFAGSTLYIQAFLVDGATPSGIGATNGLRLTFGL